MARACVTATISAQATQSTPNPSRMVKIDMLVMILCSHVMLCGCRRPHGQHHLRHMNLTLMRVCESSHARVLMCCAVDAQTKARKKRISVEPSSPRGSGMSIHLMHYVSLRSAHAQAAASDRRPHANAPTATRRSRRRRAPAPSHRVARRRRRTARSSLQRLGIVWRRRRRRPV
jgi:hypothetical protein